MWFSGHGTFNIDTEYGNIVLINGRRFKMKYYGKTQASIIFLSVVEADIDALRIDYDSCYEIYLASAGGSKITLLGQLQYDRHNKSIMDYHVEIQPWSRWTHALRIDLKTLQRADMKLMDSMADDDYKFHPLPSLLQLHLLFDSQANTLMSLTLLKYDPRQHTHIKLDGTTCYMGIFIKQLKRHLENWKFHPLYEFVNYTKFYWKSAMNELSFQLHAVSFITL